MIKHTFRILIISLVSIGATVWGQGLDDSFRLNESGMVVQKLRMAVIAENIANAATFEVEETGLPYRKKYVVVTEGPNGVRAASVQESQQPFVRHYDPYSPHANDDGYMYLPNVNLPDEMVNLSYTEIVFQANINALKTTKSLYQVAIEALK